MLSPYPDTPLQVVEERGRTTVRFTDLTSLTEDNAAEVGHALTSLAADRERPDLLLDLAAVEFLTSEALVVFVVLYRQVRAAGGRLALANVRPVVRWVFALTRLDRMLDIRGAVDALSA
jgi:anti-anti-sigma factor